MTDVLLGSPTTAPAIPVRVAVPCVYCRGAIAADSFVDWPDGKPLLSAACPSCARRVTLPTTFLRRWCCDMQPVGS
jgi:hypothetical protein